MVTSLGGTITAASSEGQGCTFRFSLPLSLDQSAWVKNQQYSGPERRAGSGSDRRSGVDRRMASRLEYYLQQVEQDYESVKLNVDPRQFENRKPDKPTILICEDTVGQINLLIECLQDDYNLLFAGNGVEGLSKLAQNGDRIGLILSDMKMPDMGGLEFCREVFSQDRFLHIPFVFITAYVNEYEQLEGIKYGATDYLQKPFNREILKEKINHWLERRAAEAMLKGLVEDLEGKNVELSRLRSIITHEIRNPLQILSLAEMYIDKLKTMFYESTAPDKRKYWDKIVTVREVSETIQNILDSAKQLEEMGGGHLAEEVVGELFDHTLLQTRQLVEGMELKLQCGVAPQTKVKCDKKMLTQVFVNVIRNATEAIKEKGSKDAGRIEVDILPHEDEKLRIAIKDNGVGISAEGIKKLFTYKHTTKADGTGIGLYLSKKIMRMHGGDMWVESNPGEGATFIVTLPLKAK
jgi:signal transduction histidine kinase